MKKFLIALFIMLFGFTAFATQTIYVAHYQNAYGDEIQAAVSPLDGNLYVIINGMNNIIFQPAGVDEAGAHWHSGGFGDMLFSRNGKYLQVLEYSSGKIWEFWYTGVHTEEIP